MKDYLKINIDWDQETWLKRGAKWLSKKGGAKC